MTLYYCEEHLWFDVEDDHATVGITQHATEFWPTVMVVDLEAAGDTFAKGDEMGSIDYGGEIFTIVMPVTGEIIETHEALSDSPEDLMDDPEGAAWLYKIRLTDSDELSELLDAKGYAALIR